MKSLTTTSSLIDKQPDSISFRIDFIKNLLGGKKLEPIIDLGETCETIDFINPMNEERYDANDTRCVLNKKIFNFSKIIKDIGGGQLKYIKSGTTGHTFRGTLTDYDDILNFAVKVVAYSRKEKYGDQYDITRPENAELLMIRLLSYFVIKQQTPHIVLPIGTFDTPIKTFVSLIDHEIVNNDNKKYQEFLQKYNDGEYYDNVSVLISEWANRGDLLDFIRKNYKRFDLIHWKNFFFQIISTLAVIQSKYPDFRHNDFKANNILVQKISQTEHKFSYVIKKYKYIVPNMGYQIKIWDFDFACIDGIIENSKVNTEWAKSINITKNRNKYYDIHYFFNTLQKKGFFPEFLIDPKIPQEVKSFAERIVPEVYQSGRKVHKRGRLLVNDEYTTPDRILKTDPFFEEFRDFTYTKTVMKKNN